MISSFAKRVVGGIVAGLISASALATLAAAPSAAWFTRIWQTDDGLPNNIVVSLAQTQDGFLWVGTPAGVARFDGVRFSEFPYLRAGANGHPAIHTITPGRAGGLWIVPTRGQVVHLNKEFSDSPLPANLPDANPLIVAEDNQGCPWIGYANGNLCQIKNGQVIQFGPNEGLPTGSIESLISDKAGNIWIAKGLRVYIFRSGRFRQVALVKSEPHLAASRSGGVWIVDGKQLLKCDFDGGLQDLGVYEPETVRGSSREAMEDHTGAVWIGTDTDGLYRHSESGFEKIETSFGYISSLAEDSEGNIWAGTLGGGLDRITPRGVQLVSVNTGSSLQPIQSLCQDNNGLLWGATQDGCLVSRVDGMWTQALTNVPKSVTCVAAGRDGSMWIGLRNSRSLYCYRNGKLKVWDEKSGFNVNTVVALLPDSRGDLWIGVNAYHTNPPSVERLHSGKFQVYKLPSADRVTAFAEDAAGVIWTGTTAGFLLRAEGDQLIDETAHTSASDRGVRCLYATPDGALWIGYAGLGLGCLKDKHFARITASQGLPENNISQIVEDNEGWLWLGGDHGIFKVRRDAVEQAAEGKIAHVIPICYGRNEGLFNLQTDFGFWPGALFARDGHVCIPTRTALAVADTTLLYHNSTPPPVLLTGIVVDDQLIAAYGGLKQIQVAANLQTLRAPLRLSPYHRNLRFDFTAFDFSAPENVHFRYRMDGLDTDWRAADGRSANYSRLAAGDYQFRVQAANGDGSWQELDAPVGLIVAPFFWQTWWFRSAVLAFFALCVIAVVRYVSFRRLRRRLEILAQQAALDKERTRIARDLHDDLGGSLTQVKQLFELALRNHASPEKMSQFLEQGLAKTQLGIRALDETVWAVNPHNDTLPYLIDYLGQAVVEFLHASDIRCRANLPVNPPGRIISAEVRHNLFLVVKEAVNNIVRHARATEVHLEAVMTDECLTLTIHDNGCGFAPGPVQSGSDGLRNMRERMEEIGGKFSLTSHPGAGTTVSVVYFWAARPTLT